jgi:hypothetical protein
MSGWCCLIVRTVTLLWHVITIIRTVSGRCCPVVQTDAAVFPYMCLTCCHDVLWNFDERPDMLPWRPDGCNLELFESSRHWWASERMTWPSGRNLGIQFLCVGICIESSFEYLEPLFWNEDSKINGIPDYVVVLHNNDFVKQNAANHKLTIRKLHAYTLHPSGRQGNTVRTRSCYGNYVQTKCNRPDSWATPSGSNLNMEMHGVRYGKPIAQKTIRMLNASIWSHPREIRDKLVLGLLSL